jgi:uncharacterized protein (TIGR02996 family)
VHVLPQDRPDDRRRRRRLLTDRLRALFDAILAKPNDDDLRLVYADALEEDGDVAQADLIRIGIAIASGRASAADTQRAAELEKEHGARIVGPAIGDHAESWSFYRGFVSTIRGIPLTALADALAVAPIQTIVLGRDDDDVDPEETLAAARAVAASPRLASVKTLDMSEGTLGDWFDEGERLRLLVESPYLHELATILVGTECSTAAAIAVAKAHERLPALRELRFGAPLGDGRVGDEGAIAIAGSPLCAQLTTLEILASGVSEQGITALASSFRDLTELWMGGTWYVQNPIKTAGALALAKSKGLMNLTALDIGGGGIRDEGAIAIAQSPWLKNVRYLDLSDNDLTTASVLALAHSPFAKNLQSLMLSHGGVHPGHVHWISQDALDALWESIPSLREISAGPEGGALQRRPSASR